METEIGSFHFPDFAPTQLNSRTRAQDILSSLLEVDDCYNSTFPDDLPDLDLLDDTLFNFGSCETETVTDPVSLPHISSTHETFLLELSDTYHPILPPETCFSDDQQPVWAPTTDDTDMFLKEDMCLIAPADSHQSTFGDALIGSVVASTSTSAGATLSETSVDGRSMETNAVAQVPAPTVTDLDEEGEDETDNTDPKPGTLNCKNLVSERNRRKRLSQQLLALRALVPNITKMDKRSVLVDALAYLRGIHEETAMIQKELTERARKTGEPCMESNAPDPCPQPRTLPQAKRAKPKTQILEIDIEKIEDRRFVLKITCKGGSGIGGEVLRVIESLGFEITYTALEQIKPNHVLTTVFIRVRRQGRMTEEKLKECITSTALRSGLTLQNP